MDDLSTCVASVVTAGVKSYIGLLCAGELERSRRLLSDTMQISSLSAGGPSAGIASRGDGSVARCMIFFTLRSLLASLLVLRATAYWGRVPALEELQEACTALNAGLGRISGRASWWEPGERGGAAAENACECGRESRARCGSDGGCPGSGVGAADDDDEACGCGERTGGPGSGGPLPIRTAVPRYRLIRSS